MFRKLGITLLMASFVLLAGRSAFADTTYNLSLGNSAITPAPYNPFYGSVLVHLTSSTTATVTFTADAGYLFLDSSIADVNVNATSWTVSGLTGSNSISGFGGPALSDGGSGNVDGWGVFNQTFNESDGFTDALQTVTFTLTDTSGTWADSGSVLKANSNGAFVAAHVGICNVDPCTFTGGSFANTGYASQGGAINTPEPSSLVLLGTGVMGAAAMLRRRIKVPTA